MLLNTHSHSGKLGLFSLEKDFLAVAPDFGS